MKQKWNFGPYTTYLWTLITILITIAILFVCTYLPGLLWDMTSNTTGNLKTFTLDLPDVEEIISSSVDTSAIPPYYPPLSVDEHNPGSDYTLIAVEDATTEVNTYINVNEEITAFSELVVDAMNSYFYLSCSPSIIAQHTNLWSVCPTGQSDVVDFYYSTTVVVQQATHLWTVTAYGSPTALTHLSRSPYSDSDNTSEAITWNDETLKEAVSWSEEITAGDVQNTFANFLINSADFNKQLYKEAPEILEYENYEITAGENTSQGQLYTVHFWSVSSDAEFEMVLRLQYSSKMAVKLLQTISISQIK